MLPEGIITSHSDNYCSYVLNITTFLFPSEVIYLGGWIKNIWTLYQQKFLNLAPANLLARYLASSSNIYIQYGYELTFISVYSASWSKQYKNVYCW